MKVLPKVNKDGYFVEDIEIRGSGTINGVINHWSVDVDPAIPGYIVGYPIPEGLYSPKLDVERLKKEFDTDDGMKWYDGSDPGIAKKYWIEGLTLEEIDEITKPNALSEMDVIRQEVANQNSAIWEYLLFGGA